YHDFLSDTIAKSYFTHDEDDENYQQFIEDYNLDNTHWFIPMDFNWNNILGSEKWVKLDKTN
ncbi:MAG: hypothetical protein ACOYEG_14400, partial [Petrimonas sp.]